MVGMMFSLIASSIPRHTRRRAIVLLCVSAASAMVTACGDVSPGAGPSPASRSGADTPLQDFSARFARFQPADEPNGDLAKVVWPDFVTRAGPEVKRLYEFQVVNGDLTKYMPCFCGCGRDDGHRNNRDCYIREVRPDGSVVFDGMAPT